MTANFQKHPKRLVIRLSTILFFMPSLLPAQNFDSFGISAGVGRQKYDRLYLKASPFWQDKNSVWQILALANLGLNDDPYYGDSSMGELGLVYGKYTFISGLYLSASSGISFVTVNQSNPEKTRKGLGIPFEVQAFLQNPVAGLGIIAHANVNAWYTNFSFAFCAKIGWTPPRELSAKKQEPPPLQRLTAEHKGKFNMSVGFGHAHDKSVRHAANLIRYEYRRNKVIFALRWLDARESAEQNPPLQTIHEIGLALGRRWGSDHINISALGGIARFSGRFRRGFSVHPNTGAKIYSLMNDISWSVPLEIEAAFATKYVGLSITSYTSLQKQHSHWGYFVNIKFGKLL